MKTNIQGYYNGNEWPIMLCVSERNLTLQLAPGEHVVDSTGRKVNDPLLERYVSKRGLSREVVASQGDVNPLPTPVNAVNIQSRATASPVLQATGFKMDKKGAVTPVFEVPKVNPAPAPQGTPGLMTVNQPGSSVRAFTVEEAQRAGLIGKIKPLPEDYGATETGTGVPAPGNQIPELRLPMEATRPPVRPLPVELTQLDEKMDPSKASVARSLQSNLAQAARNNPDSLPTRPLANPVVPPVTEAEAVAAPAPLPVKRVIANPLSKIMSQTLPEPNMPGITPQPPAVDLPVGAPASAKQVMDKTFVCPLCDSEPMTNRGVLKRHANRYHPEKVAEVLAAYPLVSGS